MVTDATLAILVDLATGICGRLALDTRELGARLVIHVSLREFNLIAQAIHREGNQGQWRIAYRPDDHRIYHVNQMLELVPEPR